MARERRQETRTGDTTADSDREEARPTHGQETATDQEAPKTGQAQTEARAQALGAATTTTAHHGA